MLAASAACCYICDKPFLDGPVHIDHDHDTKEVRGLLCVGCNTGLGLLGDNMEGVTQVMCYLQGSLLCQNLIMNS